jgi:small subunit ribosomal protein S9
MAVQFYEGIGRRKESTARVRVMNGAGKFMVNEKTCEAYFTRLGDVQAVSAPLVSAGENPSNLDITVVVKGGGVTGQVSAVQMALARALQKMNPDLHVAMRKGGYLTRDARIKERKKPGLKRARKAPTYTKR